jgi:hypothetical protein
MITFGAGEEKGEWSHFHLLKRPREIYVIVASKAAVSVATRSDHGRARQRTRIYGRISGRRREGASTLLTYPDLQASGLPAGSSPFASRLHPRLRS